MTAIETRGGFPFVTRRSVPTGTSAQQLFASPGHIKYLQVMNEGANVVRLYFAREDYDADTSYVELAATTGTFSGPVELRSRNLFIRAVGGAADPVVVIMYLRR